MKGYRFITDNDTSDFCHRVTEALSSGWKLYGEPQYVFNNKTGKMRCGHHQNSNTGFRKIPKIELKGKKSLFPIIFCSTIFFLSFIFPLSQMVYWTAKFPKYFQDTNIIALNFNTLILVF